MASTKNTVLALTIVMSLALTGCSTNSATEIENSVTIETPGSETVDPGGQAGGSTTDPNAQPQPTETGSQQELPTTAAEFNYSNPSPSDNPSSALDLVAKQSISVMSLLGVLETFEDQRNNTIVKIAFDPTETGNQVALQTEYRDGSQATTVTAGKKSSILTAYLALILVGDEDSSIQLKADHFLVDIGGKGIYKYYFANGVITKVEGTITGEKPFIGTLEYKLDKEVKDLVSQVN
jgi:hypothetical protein